MVILSTLAACDASDVFAPLLSLCQIVEASVQLNYTTFLNGVFLVLAAVLVWRFLTTGGPEMLRMMDVAPASAQQ